MLIVDGQIHLWEKGTPSAHHRQKPHSAEQAIAGMDEAGVDRALIHPVLWDPDSNELAVEAVRQYPDRFAIMGWFYLDDPQGRDLVAHWKERPGMLGLRFYTNERHPQSWFTDSTLDWLWPAVERAQVPVSLGAAMFLPTVGKIAECHPGLKLIVDHMGVPRASKGEAAYRFQPELVALAKYPNVAVKATGQAGYAEDECPFRSLHPHLHRCFDAFGPQRMFWGTDITRMRRVTRPHRPQTRFAGIDTRHGRCGGGQQNARAGSRTASPLSQATLRKSYSSSASLSSASPPHAPSGMASGPWWRSTYSGAASQPRRVAVKLLLSDAICGQQ
jgi:predicted TIM-barrel fold metal-dependent hydrolase